MIGLEPINACKSHEAQNLFIIFYLTLDVRVHHQKKSFCSIWSIIEQIKHLSQSAGTLLLLLKEQTFYHKCIDLKGSDFSLPSIFGREDENLRSQNLKS